VQRIAVAIGEELGLEQEQLDVLRFAGLFHDIGKIGVPDAILLKPGPLDAEELTTMHLHPIIGANIVAPLRSSAAVLPIIRHHHENYDGSGYPDRLAGEGIPRLARVVAVCDAFDALINDRPYRARKTPDEAIAILHAGARRQWDPDVVDVFTRQFAQVTSLGAA
jgi:putative nucleotidyltransferase with HDIG domain